MPIPRSLSNDMDKTWTVTVTRNWNSVTDIGYGVDPEVEGSDCQHVEVWPQEVPGHQIE